MPAIGARRTALLGGKSIYARVRDQLRRRGHSIFLPGVGTIGGLATGTYSDSAGNDVAVRDDPLGRWVDAGAGGLVLVQDATADKPILSKLINLARSSQGFLNTYWTTNGDAGWTDGYGIAPDGTWTTTLCIPGGTRYQPIFAKQNEFYTVGFHYKKTADTITRIYVDSIGTLGGQAFLDINLGDLSSSGPQGGAIRFNLEDVGAFVRVSLTIRSSESGGLMTYHNYPLIGNVECWGAQIVQGASPGRYQRVNTPTDYDAEGFPWRVSFGATDTMSAIIPAGYEAATVIYSTPGGQITLVNQNLSAAGVFTLGPNAVVFGVIICKTHPGASVLALYQAMMNKQAGL